MNLYRISQSENFDYDTYDSAVVAAETEQEARSIHPGSGKWGSEFHTWASSPEVVKVELIGTADPSIELGVICASFNAG
jgi:hypothetical protein